MEQQAIHDYLYKVSVKVESDQNLILIEESLFFSTLKIFSNLASKVLFLLYGIFLILIQNNNIHLVHLVYVYTKRGHLWSVNSAGVV